MKPDLPKRKSRRELVLPRWAIPLVWAVIVLVIQILLPWAIAKLGPRFGWSQLAPAWWNLTGLIAVASVLHCTRGASRSISGATVLGYASAFLHHIL
jgi:hypothetical protein